VPAGFYLSARSLLSPGKTARAQGLNEGQYIRQGGGASVTELFLLRQPATVGLTLISSQVIAFRSAGSAVWGFREIRSALARSGTIGTVQVTLDLSATPTPLPTGAKPAFHPVAPPPSPYQPERLPRLGDEHAGFRNTSAAYAGEYVFDNQAVLVRRGRYCAIVRISGNYGQAPLSEAMALARRIEERIPGR
jgi:hypothetical protein